MKMKMDIFAHFAHILRIIRGQKSELLRQYPDKKITNISLKSKNLQ